MALKTFTYGIMALALLALTAGQYSTGQVIFSGLAGGMAHATYFSFPADSLDCGIQEIGFPFFTGYKSKTS
jgi:hypothetical protein